MVECNGIFFSTNKWSGDVFKERVPEKHCLLVLWRQEVGIRVAETTGSSVGFEEQFKQNCLNM